MIVIKKFRTNFQSESLSCSSYQKYIPYWMEVPQVCFESRPISFMLSEFRRDFSWLEVHLKNGSSKGGILNNSATAQTRVPAHCTSAEAHLYNTGSIKSTPAWTQWTVHSVQNIAHRAKHYPQYKTVKQVQNIAHSKKQWTPCKILHIVHLSFTTQPPNQLTGKEVNGSLGLRITYHPLSPTKSLCCSASPFLLDPGPIIVYPCQ